MSYAGVLLFVFAGALAWSLAEYLLHRFAFHRPGRFLGQRHLQHHARPNDRSVVRAAWPAWVVGGGALGLGLFALLSPPVAGALFAGFMGSYFLYEEVHAATHFRVPRSRFAKWLRTYHLLHHHKTPKARFGVTSPLWDLVFGTYAPVERRRR